MTTATSADRSLAAAATVVALVLVSLAWLRAPAAYAEDRFHLKPGASGAVCLGCHDDFAAKLKAKFVHTPVKTGDCTGCHSPHTSAHGKLLAASPRAICLTCHADVVPAKASSAHKVVVEGNCVACHDPHASNNKANLKTAGNALCVGCHTALKDAITTVKFKHAPVTDGCLGCHNPHASEKAPHLLRSAVPSLCVGCHAPDSPSFSRQHAGYPVGRGNCVSCHQPHGSNTPGMLLATVHGPVASKRCDQCHNPATSPRPFETKRAGFELCGTCHGAMLKDTLDKRHAHWPVLDRKGCLNCHEPHASRQPKLVNVDEATLCGRCHKDTLDWQARLAQREQQDRAALKKKKRVEIGALTHEPVQKGRCSACHVPHGSDEARLMRQDSTIELCGSCHDWLKHNSHPMGERYRDARNKNVAVDCLSCHRSHGTGYRSMITTATSTDLCVQCHKRQRR